MSSSNVYRAWRSSGSAAEAKKHSLGFGIAGVRIIVIVTWGSALKNGSYPSPHLHLDPQSQSNILPAPMTFSFVNAGSGRVEKFVVIDNSTKSSSYVGNSSLTYARFPKMCENVPDGG